MSLTVDVPLEAKFRSLYPEEWAQWWSWVAEVIGRDPKHEHIRELTLGEGVLLGLVESGAIIDLEPEVIPVCWAAPTPPPCWPRGEWAEAT